MNNFYENIPYITSVLIIVLATYPLIYLKFSNKKLTEAQEKSVKKFKKLYPILIILAVLNILARLFKSI